MSSLTLGLGNATYPQIGSSTTVLALSYYNTPTGYKDVFAGVGYGPTTLGQIQEPTIYSPKSVVLYVSASGDNTTGLTLATAFTTIASALTYCASNYSGGDVLVLIASGTYSENNSGRLILSGTFSDWVSFEPLTGRLGDVIVKDTSAGGNGILNLRSASASKIQFRKIAFVPTSIGTASILYHNPSSSAFTLDGLHLVECSLSCPTDASTVFLAINLSPGTTDSSLNDLQFIDCTFLTTGAAAAKPRVLKAVPKTLTANNQPVTNVGLYNCRTAPSATFSEFSTQAWGIDGFTIVGSKFAASVNYGGLIGSDNSGDQSGSPVPKCTRVYIGQSSFTGTGTNGHGLEIGNNVQSAVVEHCVVTGSLHGIVVKGATSATVRRCSVRVTGAASLDGLLAKGSTGTKFLGNTVYVQTSSATAYAFREDLDTVSSIKSASTSLFGNVLIADGANASLVYWGPSTASTGSGQADSNVFETRNSAVWGSFRGTTVASLSALQTAWSSGLAGDVAGSDAGSQTNAAGSRNDASYAGTTALTYYCRYLAADGRNFTGLSLEPYVSGNHQRYSFAMPETTTSGTFARPNPFNLPSTPVTVVVQRQMGAKPDASDPILTQQALAYAS